MLNVITCIAILAVAPAGQRSADFTQKIPGFLPEFHMVRIPDGSVTIDGKAVAIRNLYVGETEVTWDIFDIWAFRLDQTSEDQAAGVDAKSRPSKPYGAPDKGFGHAGFPALGMTRLAAEEFCRWLSAKTKRTYRLPTAAEWQYAAAAGSKSLPASLDQHAWYWDNAEDKTHPVKSLKPNEFGLYDTLGNVGEWVVTADGEPALAGGHFLSRKAGVGFEAVLKQTPKWNENDPQNPKSKWWLANAPFAGFRVVFVEEGSATGTNEVNLKNRP